MSFFRWLPSVVLRHVPLRVITDERSSLGERAKRIEYPFCETIPHKARRLAHRVYRGATSDYAPAAARSDNPEVKVNNSDGAFGRCFGGEIKIELFKLLLTSHIPDGRYER